MKKFVPLLLVIVCLAALLGACDDRPEYTFNNVDRCEYVLDESGHHVGNINFDDYLSPAPQSTLWMFAPSAQALPLRPRQISAPSTRRFPRLPDWADRSS